MSLIFNSASVKESSVTKGRWDELNEMRQAVTNSAGAVLLPESVYVELDRQVKQIIEDPYADVLYRDLTALSVPVSSGTTITNYRRRSNESAVTVSVFGDDEDVFQKGSYDNTQDVLAFFKTGFQFGAKEFDAYKDSELNALADEQDAAVRSIRAAIEDSFLDGAMDGAKPYSHQGVKSVGLRTSDRVVKQKAKVALADISVPVMDIYKEYVRLVNEACTKSRISTPRTVYISPEADTILDMPMGAEAALGTTLRSMLLSVSKIADIKVSSSLVGGEVVLGVLSREHIRVNVAREIATQPVLRLSTLQPVRFLTAGNMGLQIRADAEGHCAWSYVAAK